MLGWRGVVALVALVGCGRQEAPVGPAPEPPVVEEPGITDESPVAGTRSRSGVLVVSEMAGVSFIADPDNGAVLTWERARGQVSETPALTGDASASEPTRMARIGSELFVTLRGVGKVARFRHSVDGLEALGAVDVGAEPFDVVGHPTAATVLVSLSMEDAVVELDAASLAPLRRWSVAGEPRWLATRVDGATGHAILAVASMRGGQVTLIDLETGSAQQRGLPLRQKTVPDGCPEQPFSSRITGEILFDVDGNLLVPALYADTKIEAKPTDPPECGDGGTGGDAGEAPDSGGFVFDTGTPMGGGGGGGGGGEGGYGVPVDAIDAGKASRFNPVLTILPPSGPARTLQLGAPVMMRSFDGTNGVARGVPTGVEEFWFGDRQSVVVTMESDGAMVVLDLSSSTDERGARPFETVMRGAVPVGLGAISPRLNGVEEDQVQIWTWLDRLAVGVHPIMLSEVVMGIPEVGMEMALGPASVLSPSVLEGRRMFFSTDDARMAAAGSGVSCSACHADGRTDGFTWQFADFDRQTPSLAGPVYLTEPVTWKGDVDTVEREVHLTTTNRMGGVGVTFAEADTVAAYVNWSRSPIVPSGDAAQVARGRALFARPDVGCAACHAGPQGTFGATVPIYGLPAINVPALRGIAATAPYFHDGSAATLRDVLERSRDGSMGNTSMLSEAEMSDLEAFLRQF